MASTNAHGTELVRTACHAHPGEPSLRLARKLHRAHPGVWSGVNAVRVAITRLRGRLVDKRRRPIPAPAPCTAPRIAWNPSALPKSYEGSFVPFSFEVTHDSRALVMGDIHLPYHSLPALEATLRHGRKQGCDVVILNGDTLDFHRLSRFNKDPGSRKAVEEIAAANQLLDYIDGLLPKARKIWKDGNHEERFDHYVAEKAVELFDLVQSAASLAHLLGLADRGWEYVSQKRPIHLGHLTLIHGHEYPTPVLGPVNAARGLFLRAKRSAMVNHHHQTSEHTEPTIRDEMITTWSLGCLCDLHPQYARFNKWNHGAAIVDLAPGGAFQVRNFRIEAGRLN